MASYTGSTIVNNIKTKGWLSSSSSLSQANYFMWLNSQMQSYIVPLLKNLRDEWFVKGVSTVTPNSAGIIDIPSSIGSTVRTIAWINSNGSYVPLPLIAPENALYLLGSGQSGQPQGYMLRNNQIQILPTNVGAVQIYLTFMESPPVIVPEEDAGLIASHAGTTLTLSRVPLAWQASTPTTVDLVSNVSPFNVIAEDVPVVSLNSSTKVLILSGISSSLIADGFWVSDVGTSPYPNIPTILQPLLESDVVLNIMVSVGDQKLTAFERMHEKLETNMRKTLAPRMQGSAKVIVNSEAPGMGGYGPFGY